MSDFSTGDGARPHENGRQEQPPSSAMEAVTRRFMHYLGEDGSPLTGIWLFICIFNLGMVALSAAIQYRTGAPPFNMEMLDDPIAMRRMMQQSQTINFVALLNFPLAVLALAMYYSGFRAMRVIEKEGPNSRSFGELRAEMFSNFGTTALVSLVYVLLCGLGTACCVLPGLIAGFVFLPAPYIAATLGLGVFASLSEATHWVKRHWLLLVVAVAVSVLMSVFIVAVQFLAAPAMMSIFGKTGILITHGLSWLLGSIVGYFGWMFSGSVYITIDLAEERLGGW